jgi:hypothetical protein
MKISINRGLDGFGSQFFAILSGVAYCLAEGYEYVHTPLSGFKLLDKPEPQNFELESVNQMLSQFMSNMNVKTISEVRFAHTYPYMYDTLLANPSFYFSSNFFNTIQSAYPLAKPDYYQSSDLNFAVHIRRGADIFPNDYHARFISNDVYEFIIRKLLEKYPNANVHVFSWSNPQLQVTDSRIVYHIAEQGNIFLNDFNALVHADKLFVGSSTFSISAGLLNKNMVYGSRHTIKLHQTPVPDIWIKNLEEFVTI